MSNQHEHMKATFRQADLVRELQLLSAVIDRKVTIPVLSGVLIDVRADGVRLTATNVDNTLQSEVAATDLSPGRLVLSADRLLALVSRTVGPVAIEGHGLNGSIVAGSATAKLPGLSVEDFPLPAVVDGAPSATLPASALLDLVRQARYAMSDDIGTAKGGHCELTDEAMSLLASHEGQLAVLTLGMHCRPAAFTLSARAWDAVQKWAGALDDDAPVTLAVDDSRAVLSAAGRCLTCRLLDAAYPAIRRVVPVAPPCLVTLNADALAGAMKRHLVLATMDRCKVRMRFEGQSVDIQSETPLGEAADRLETAGLYDGAVVEIAMNPKYLLNTIEALNCERVEIGMKDSRTHIRLRSADDPDRMVAVVALMALNPKQKETAA